MLLMKEGGTLQKCYNKKGLKGFFFFNYIPMLIDEWQLLQTEKLLLHVGRINFWHSVFKIKNALGQTKYPILQKVAQMCLSVSHGSADIKWGFSLSFWIISDDRTNTSETTLNVKLLIMDALKHFYHEVDLVPVTNKLLLLPKNANKKYKEYLEVERKKKKTAIKLEEKLRWRRLNRVLRTSNNLKVV